MFVYFDLLPFTSKFVCSRKSSHLGQCCSTVATYSLNNFLFFQVLDPRGVNPEIVMHGKDKPAHWEDGTINFQLTLAVRYCWNIHLHCHSCRKKTGNDRWQLIHTFLCLPDLVLNIWSLLAKKTSRFMLSLLAAGCTSKFDPYDGQAQTNPLRFSQPWKSHLSKQLQSAFCLSLKTAHFYQLQCLKSWQ